MPSFSTTASSEIAATEGDYSPVPLPLAFGIFLA